MLLQPIVTLNRRTYNTHLLSHCYMSITNAYIFMFSYIVRLSVQMLYLLSISYSCLLCAAFMLIMCCIHAYYVLHIAGQCGTLLHTDIISHSAAML